MLTCISAQLCEGVMPDCSISKRVGAKMTQGECVCSTHGNLLTDKPMYMYAMSLIINDKLDSSYTAGDFSC